jgi:AraC-like DNA-binding protein
MEFKLQSFSTPLRVTRIANIHYFEFTHQYHTESDSHNFCELLHVDQGSLRVSSENYSGTLTDNQLIIHRPNERHFLECSESGSPNVVIIGFECSAPELARFATSPITLQPAHRNMLSRILTEGMAVYEPPYDIPTFEMKKRASFPFGADQMMQIHLESFLITLIREFPDIHAPVGGGAGKISDIYDYISEHYTEKLTLHDLCFIFGTNKTSLCRSFKETYGDTVLNHINSLRIQDAKRLLREQKLTVTQISEELGFTSIHYFCRLFKKETGMTPKEYIHTTQT